MESLSLLSAQPVIFKLLATLRLVIDGTSEAAREVGRNRSIVETVVDWGTSEAPAVKAESGRLLAGLIKHSRDAEVRKGNYMATLNCLVLNALTVREALGGLLTHHLEYERFW